MTASVLDSFAEDEMSGQNNGKDAEKHVRFKVAHEEMLKAGDIA